MRYGHPRIADDDRFSAGRLKEYGGIYSGFARTFAGALEVDRSAVLDALSGPVETFVQIDGRQGTDHPGAATNRISSEEHDQEGVDHIFLALTTEQLRSLKSHLGT
jgi:hypothetical protein